MTEAGKATPRPWELAPHPQEEGTWNILGPDDGKPGRRVVASISAVDPFEAKDTAELMFEAVNAYDAVRELVEAAQKMLVTYATGDHDHLPRDAHGEGRCVACALRAALAKVTKDGAT